MLASFMSPGFSFRATEAEDGARVARSYFSKRYKRHVLRFDHYCVWVNNDIGKHNHLAFYLFVTATVMHLGGALVLGHRYYKEIDYMAMAVKHGDLVSNDMFIIPPSMDGSRGPQLQPPDKMFQSVMTSLKILAGELGPATALLTVVLVCFIYSAFLWYMQTWHILNNITTLEYLKVAWHSPTPKPWSQGVRKNVWLFLTAWASEDHFVLADDNNEYEEHDMETDEGVARAVRQHASQGRRAVVKAVPVIRVLAPGEATKEPTARVVGIQKPGEEMKPVATTVIPAAGPIVGGATTAKKRSGKSAQ
jgi:hypothetical protein